jgi:hypothetical protein
VEVVKLMDADALASIFLYMMFGGLIAIIIYLLSVNSRVREDNEFWVEKTLDLENALALQNHESLRQEVNASNSSN